MPKLLFARPAQDVTEERQMRELAGGRHAPGLDLSGQNDYLTWQGLRTTAITAQFHCHQYARFRGLDELLGAGRKRRIKEIQRSMLVSLVARMPPGRLVR